MLVSAVLTQGMNDVIDLHGTEYAVAAVGTRMHVRTANLKDASHPDTAAREIGG